MREIDLRKLRRSHTRSDQRLQSKYNSIRTEVKAMSTARLGS